MSIRKFGPLTLLLNGILLATNVTYAQTVSPTHPVSPKSIDPWGMHFDTPPTMRANVELTSEAFIVSISRKSSEQRGWGGGCITSSEDMDLTPYKEVRITIESEHDNRVEVKLECSDFKDCQHLIHNKRIKGKKKELVLHMPGASPSLKGIRKICFAVTGQGMERGIDNTKLTIKQVVFVE